jgi:PAS domain S-box-containing protein
MGTPDLQRKLDEQALLLDSLSQHLWFMTDAETCGRVNKALADFLGLARGELEFRKLEEFLPTETAARWLAANQEVWAGGKPVTAQEWMESHEGDRRLFAVTRTPVLAPGTRTVESIICQAQDITGHHQAPEGLAQGEENFRNFIEALDDIVLIGDPEGRIIYANPAATRKLGFSAEELMELAVLDLHPEWLRAEAAEILTEMFDGRRDHCPLPLMSKGGVLVPVETRVRFGNWNGEKCIFGVSKDLTREQESLQKFEKLFRSHPALMAISTFPQRQFTDVNDTFLEVLGYKAEEALGKTTAELGVMADQEQQDRAAEILAQYGRIRDLEMTVRTKGGELRTGLFSGELLEVQGQKYFLTMMVDITDRKRVEAERETSIQELRFALEQIKTLRGVVPICASCKKIRDDKGYWEQVDAFVARHTEAQFSHGICPDCVSRLYPDFKKKSSK